MHAIAIRTFLSTKSRELTDNNITIGRFFINLPIVFMNKDLIICDSLDDIGKGEVSLHLTFILHQICKPAYRTVTVGLQKMINGHTSLHVHLLYGRTNLVRRQNHRHCPLNQYDIPYQKEHLPSVVRLSSYQQEAA